MNVRDCRLMFELFFYISCLQLTLLIVSHTEKHKLQKEANIFILLYIFTALIFKHCYYAKWSTSYLFLIQFTLTLVSKWVAGYWAVWIIILHVSFFIWYIKYELVANHRIDSQFCFAVGLLAGLLLVSHSRWCLLRSVMQLHGELILNNGSHDIQEIKRSIWPACTQNKVKRVTHLLCDAEIGDKVHTGLLSLHGRCLPSSSELWIVSQRLDGVPVWRSGWQSGRV